MIRSTLLAAASVLAMASVAVAGGSNGAAGNLSGSIDYSKVSVDHLAKGAVNNTYNYTMSAIGSGRDLGASAAANVGSGASQGTTSEALRNGATFSAAGAHNFAVTGSLAGAGAGFIGGEGTLFGGDAAVGAGLAAGAAGGISGTEVGGSSFAMNHSHGAATGTADAAQASFGQSTAGANVALFNVDKNLTVIETETSVTDEKLVVDSEVSEVDFSAEGAVYGSNPGNDKKVGNSRFDGERGEVPSRKNKKD